ncbi:MAG: twin-arginine translocase subunit TatC [Armatimonadota bacterium]|nr:twin-arginine translocase subunit TatC [Armatimonadota bacterium]MCX7776624.1 twin-arginine translocase subunit TatC [Armatimonadota bacterium]MDW8025233.1 twin-arginine translocase subunit TatC [Armatimonadota bacterium]
MSYTDERSGEYEGFSDVNNFTGGGDGSSGSAEESFRADEANGQQTVKVTEELAEVQQTKGGKRRKRRPPPNPMKEMTFVEHLAELRERLIRCFIYAALGSTIGWWQYERIWDIIISPIRPAMEKYGMPLVFTSIFEPLLFKLQLSIVAGIAIMAPLIFYEFGAFVWPALLPHEKRFAAMLLPASILFFIGGMITAYFLIPIAALFMLRFLPKDALVLNFVRLYVWSVAKIALAMGFTFQMPLVFMMLAKIGLVTSRALIRKWRHAVIAILAVSAIITPTIDPLNMMLLAAPILFLYLLSIILVLWVERR